MSTTTTNYRNWEVIDTEEWAAQARHDAPEEYGTVVTYRDPATGTVVKEETVTQPHDWHEAPYGPAECRPAGRSVFAWVVEGAR
jgi:hypothetical protein